MDENKKKSETLQQRDKARKDFLELKRMQQQNAEKEADEHVAYSGEIKPRTFAQKLAHFWEYYKIPVIAGVIIVAFVTFICAQCAGREKSDVKIVIYDNNIVPDMYLGAIEEYFEGYCEDYNGDGEVVVTVMNCSFQTGGSTAQYQVAMQQKLQSIIVGDKESMMFITSDTGYDYLQSLTDVDLLSGDGIELPQEFYEKVTLQQEIKMPGGLSVYCRNIEGTLIEDDETAIKNCENSRKLLEALGGE